MTIVLVAVLIAASVGSATRLVTALGPTSNHTPAAAKLNAAVIALVLHLLPREMLFIASYRRPAETILDGAAPQQWTTRVICHDTTRDRFRLSRHKHGIAEDDSCVTWLTVLIVP